jgi:hypothetical protein
LIDEDVLPKEYGGKNDAPIGATHYGPWEEEVLLTRVMKKWDLTDQDREQGRALLAAAKKA